MVLSVSGSPDEGRFLVTGLQPAANAPRYVSSFPARLADGPNAMNCVARLLLFYPMRRTRALTVISFGLGDAPGSKAMCPRNHLVKHAV